MRRYVVAYVRQTDSYEIMFSRDKDDTLMPAGITITTLTRAREVCDLLNTRVDNG